MEKFRYRVAQCFSAAITLSKMYASFDSQASKGRFSATFKLVPSSIRSEGRVILQPVAQCTAFLRRSEANNFWGHRFDIQMGPLQPSVSMREKTLAIASQSSHSRYEKVTSRWSSQSIFNPHRRFISGARAGNSIAPKCPMLHVLSPVMLLREV